MPKVPIYGNWEDWSACSKSCGGGSRTRTRKCTGTNPPGGVCNDETVTEQCNTDECKETNACKKINAYNLLVLLAKFYV